jgi:glycosyltransferase involved in cell wall biosynthesis
MACGTPVVGFDTGGIPDMIQPGKTGWLAEVGDTQSLQEAIEQALQSSEDRERMGEECRKVVLEEYTLEHQAQDYLELYENISS